jgi:O-antigen/teichoic acid export membrane protein
VRKILALLIRGLNTPAGISAGRVATSSLSLVTAPIIANAIGTEGRGYTAAALAAIQIASVFIAMGIPLAVRRRAVLAMDLPSLVKTARLFAWFTLLPALLIAVVLVLTLLDSMSIGDKFAFVVSMAVCPLTVSWIIDTNVLVAQRAFFRILCLGSIQTIAYFGAIVSLWVVGQLHVGSVLWAFSLGTLAAFVLGRIWVSGSGGHAGGMKSLMGEGLKLWGSQAAEIASYRLDQLLVLPIIGASATGIYSVAVTIGALPMNIAIGLGASVFRGFATDNDRRSVSLALRLALVLSVSASGCLALLSVWLIPGLFGSDFAPAVPVSFVTLVGSLFIVGNYICTMALVAQNRGGTMTIVQTVGLLAGIGLMYPFGMLWGSIGAAAASSIGFAVTFLANLFVLRIRPWAVVPRPGDLGAAVRVFFRRGKSQD